MPIAPRQFFLLRRKRQFSEMGRPAPFAGAVPMEEEESDVVDSCRSTVSVLMPLTLKTSDEPPHNDVVEKHVSFSTVSIRAHEVILGDHPCCAEGCPLSLGWQYNEVAHELDVDDYERFKSPRAPHEWKMPLCERRKILLDHSGCTEEELRQVNRAHQRCKDSRTRKREEFKFFHS